ncbi:putative cytochrome P450 superfamily [Helianthus annuus]|nr:putative cytochrome P450 superfamily [Helianthus annuus]
MIKKIQGANESVVNLSELLISLTNNVISRVALGRTYEGMGVNYKNIPVQIGAILGRFSIGSYIPQLAWVDRLTGLHREADQLAKEIDEFYEGVIEEHVNKKVVGVEGQDLVDILLELQRDNSSSVPLERYTVKAIIMVTYLSFRFLNISMGATFYTPYLLFSPPSSHILTGGACVGPTVFLSQRGV